ncbi:ribonuclease inhibitor-like [Hemibagrus wyckioides]|uniref:ribonuclease inhibitor-like n=1 Tax=Hemibagrus wyckioides TaxID=337641 RepID=UPI00266CBDD9|nr:ribonuclease inhibitor-like [Hemibagrus wyckioides]
MGLRSLRVVNQLLHCWRSALTSEEHVQLMDYQNTETGPAENGPSPQLNIAPDLDGCADPLLECWGKGEMDFGLCNSVRGKSCADLSSALCTNPSHIRELDLSECELGDSGVEKLCDLLKKHECKLEKLRLYNCRITDRGCAALTEALKINSHLKELNLRGNKLENSVRDLEEILKRSGGELIY